MPKENKYYQITKGISARCNICK